MSRESLFLCHRIPFPPNKGDKIRSHAMLKHLAQQGRVHVGCFVDEMSDLQYADEVRKLAGGKCIFIPLSAAAKWRRAAVALVTGQPITTAYFGSPALQRWVDEITAKRHLTNLVVFSSAMAPYLMDSQVVGRRVLFDMVDVDSDKWRQYARSGGWQKLIYAREARSLEKLERAASRRFGVTLLVSPFEAETFKKIAPESAAKILSLANGIDLERFSPGNFSNPFPAGQVPIVMTGRMDYRPNHDGARWFAECVAPLVFAKLPAAHVYFVGSNPPASLCRLSGAQITVTGDVDDVRPYIQHAQVIVAPLLIARGVQNKVLEAMAMRRPIVATYEATRALDVVSGEQLWIENDPQRFANAVLAAALDPAQARVMDNARTYVEKKHNWARIFAELDAILDLLDKNNATDAGCHLERAAAKDAAVGVAFAGNKL